MGGRLLRTVGRDVAYTGMSTIAAMALNYQTPPEHNPMAAQKLAAVILFVCGGAMIIGVRLFVDARPGPNPLALFAMVAGWGMVIVGAVWYLACRKAEEMS